MAEIQEKRNHSWFRETIRNKELADRIFEKLESGASEESFITSFPELDVTVIKYLVDNPVTKAKFVYESFQMARVLKLYGISKDAEFSVFMDRTPEYTYLLGAANIVAAKINLVCEKFSLDYIRDWIIGLLEHTGSVLF